MCRDLSDLGVYAKVGNAAYRQLKAATPGPYTFILPATREVPRRLVDEKRKSIGLRVPDNEIARGILDALGEPIMTTTMRLPDDEYPQTDPEDLRAVLEHSVELIIDGGHCGIEPTTVVDLTLPGGEVIRNGQGVFE